MNYSWACLRINTDSLRGHPVLSKKSDRGTTTQHTRTHSRPPWSAKPFGGCGEGADGDGEEGRKDNNSKQQESGRCLRS